MAKQKPAAEEPLEKQLWKTADKLRKNIDAAEYKHIVLGRVFEYFLGEFALAEGKQGGQFYTPRSVVELLVEMLEPYQGRVYDPCCGSGGMFVHSERFVTEHQGRVNDTLRQFGYPPDMELLATETVLKQAELIANELTKKA